MSGVVVVVVVVVVVRGADLSGVDEKNYDVGRRNAIFGPANSFPEHRVGMGEKHQIYELHKFGDSYSQELSN